jgi:hypothetical protein
MTKPHKFRPGLVIKHPGYILTAASMGKWIYLYDRPKHPGFILSMKANTIIYLTKRGFFRHAIENNLTEDNKNE